MHKRVLSFGRCCGSLKELLFALQVGKKAEDNDQLSCSPEHRDGSDWWMHAAGCPGSHVVIRCGDSSLDNEVVEDAAALAARQSKCNGSVIKVSLLLSCLRMYYT